MSKFRKDLKYANEKELAFAEKYSDKVVLLDGRKSDVRLIKSGHGIELKFEKRKSTDTGNLFLERHSHKILQTPGGAWSAKLAGSTYIMYIFSDDKLYCYNIDALISWVNENEKSLRKHNVNPAYGSNAMGYIIPLIDLSILELNWEDII